MHRKRRKNNLVWLFALLGILVLFLGTILAFLIFSNLSSKPTETVQEVSAVNGTGIVLPSHFTERKITDPSTARDAINDVADTLGIVSVEDELGTADCSTVLGDTYYSFPQVYRGIPVYGRKVTVSADADSEAALLTSGFYPIENLSVEAKITQNDAEKIVAGLYPGEADIYVNNLVIFSLDKTNPELAWKISVHQNNSWESVFLSAVDGRALKTFSNELTDNESSSNRFTNVYLYNAENRDIEVDFRIIFDDGTTAIYDGDDYRETFNKDLFDADKNIIISSPAISGPKVYELIRMLKEKQEEGVQITIVTWTPDSYGFGDASYWMQLHEDMRKAGFYIKTVEEYCDRFAVIDQEVVWYGNINLLAKDKIDDSIMRVMSKEIAGELMEITFGKKQNK